MCALLAIAVQFLQIKIFQHNPNKLKTRLLICLLIILFVFGARKASATSYIWVGYTSTSWTTASNWYNQSSLGTGNGYPGSSGTSDVANIGTNVLNLLGALFGGTYYQPTLPASSAVTISQLNFGNVYTNTLTLNSALTVSGTVTIGGNTTISGTTTLSGASLAFGGNYTLTDGTTTFNVSGAMTMSTGYGTVTFINDPSGNAPTLTISGGVTSSFNSLTFTATNPGTVSITGGLTYNGSGTFSVGSGVTMNLSSGSITENGYGGTFTNAGNITATSYPFNFNSAISFTNSGKITTNANIALAINGTTFYNSGTITINPASSTAISTLTFSGSGMTFNNASSGSIILNGLSSVTSTLCTIGAGGALTNSGSITASNATILINGNTLSPMNNAGTISLTSSPFTITNNSSTFNNSGTFSASGSAVTLGTSSNGVAFNNSGTLTLTASSTFNYPGNSVSFQNTGNVNATSSAMNFTGNVNYFQNSSPGVVAISGSTMTFSTQCYIANGSSATFTANGSSTITLNGSAHIANSGTFNAGTSNSACIINAAGPGTSTQANETITNTSPGVFNVGSTSVINLTATAAGNPTIFNNISGTTTLMSDQYGSATIGTLGTGGSCQGTFNVQRYITPGYRGYRLLSCPINTNGYTPSSSNVIDLSYLGSSTYTSGEFIAGPGTGFGTNGTLSHTITNPTIYLYQESALPGTTYNSTFTSGKNIGIYSIGTNSVTTTSTATNGISTSGVKIPAGNGYISYFIGPYNITSYTSASPATATSTAPGYINQGTITLYMWGTSPSSTLTYTTTTGNRNPGYTMVGNPYPSTLDLHALYNDTYNSSNNQKVINPSFYELNDQSQSYSTYNASTGSSGTGASQYVASGQGFFISVVSGISSVTNKNLTFTESDKPSSTTAATFPPTLLLAALPPSSKTNISTGLHLKLSMDNVNIDECGIYFRSDWKDTYDEKYDSFDLDGVSPKVFLSSYSSDNVRTSVNALSDYTYGKRIKLFVKATTDGIYKLNLEDIINVDTTNYKVYLLDKKLNDSLDMVHYTTYTFNFYTADTASFANRFVLAIERKATPPYNLITFSGQKAGSNAIQLNWNTANEGNYTTFGLEKLGTNGNYTVIDSVQSNGSGIYAFNDQNPVTGNNIYRLAQNDIHGKVTFAGPININYNTISVSGMFTIYPNPSKEMINIAVNSGVTGSKATPVYLASIYSLSGSVMDSKQVNTNNWTQDITGYKAGVYILELKTADGNIVGKAKFVKTN